MKKKGNIWLCIIFFFIGTIVSYYLCQWKYFEIDTKINVSTTLISSITLLIGLFIATTLKRNQNKTSNLHNYLLPKLNSIWEKYISLSHQLDLSDQIKVSDLSKAIKELTQNTTSLKKMFFSFELSCSCIEFVEHDFELLEKFLVKCPISKNVINYKSQKAGLSKRLEEIHAHFADTLKKINSLS